MRKILLSILLVLGVLVSSLQGSVPVRVDAAETNPMRALWLRPKETTKTQVEAVVQKIADAGINTIFLETVFNGYTIFPVTYDATYQNPDYRGFDVLQAYIDACHARGIQLHCWVESFFIGMEWEDAGGPVYKANKDWLLTDKEGNNWEDTIYGKMYFLNPARPECRDWIVNLYKILVKNYDIDGIQLDYVRYPEKTEDKDYGFDEYTINAFIKEHGFDPTNAKEGSYEAESFVYFKQQQVTKYVKACSDSLRAIKPELIISLSVYPFFSQGKTNFMQSAKDWMDKGYGDLVVPMAYYENQVEKLTNDAIAVAGGSVKNTVIGLSSQNGFTVDSLAKQTDVVLNKGAGVAFFEYESFFQGGYTSKLKNGALKNTQFHIDPKVYAANVDRNQINAPKGYLNRTNSYDYDMGYTKDICVFASQNASDTVLTLTKQDEATFAWWYNFVLEYNAAKGKWIVTKADMQINNSNECQTEPLGENKMVVMFHEDVANNQRESVEFFLQTVRVGQEYWLVGDSGSIVSGSDKLNGVYLTTENPNATPTPTPTPDVTPTPTPDITPDQTPDATQKPTPEPTPDMEPETNADSQVTEEPTEDVAEKPTVGETENASEEVTEETTEDNGTMNKPSNNGIYIVLGAIAVVLVAGGGLLTYILRKKKQIK